MVRALCEVGAKEVCGISAAKLLTVVRIRLTAAVIRAESIGFPMCADCSSAGRFWLRSEITLWIFCSVAGLGLALYSPYRLCSRFKSRLACAEMFWITAVSAALACCPDARVLHQRGDVERHLGKDRQVLQCEVDPLRAAPRGRERDREHEGKDGFRFGMRFHGFLRGVR